MANKMTRINAGEGLEQDKTDWKKIDALKEEDIDCSDIPDYGAEFWKTAAVVHPSEKQQLTIRLDRDIVEWVKQQGKGYQIRINSILRTYYEAHRDNTP